MQKFQTAHATPKKNAHTTMLQILHKLVQAVLEMFI